MKRFLVIIFCFTFSLSLAFSQGYQKELLWVGPTLGYGFGNIGYGANGEYGLTDNIGLGAELGLTSFSEDFGGMLGNKTSFEYSLLGILVAGSYHLTPGEKFDPYIKAGVGYFNWDFVYTQDGKEVDLPTGTSSAYTSGVTPTFQIGTRYHFNQMVSARASLGYPFIFAAGVDFAFGDMPKTEKQVENEEKERLEKAEKETAAETIEEKAPEDRFNIFIGPYFGVKAGLNTNVPNGRKTGVAMGFPDIGASFLLPFTKGSTIGFMLGLGHESYAYISKPDEDADDDNTFTEKYNYINLSPSLYLGGFILGLNVGFPISASAEDKTGKEVTMLSDNGITTTDFAGLEMVDYLATNLEVKLGANIPLVKNDNGMLNLNINASYSLSGLYENHKAYRFAYEENKAKSEFNPSPVSIHIGMSYLFSIGM